MTSGSGVVLGGATTTAGSLVLPNTSGNAALTVAAIVSIAVGALIVLTAVARMVTKHSKA